MVIIGKALNLRGLSVVSTLQTRQRLSKTRQLAAEMLWANPISDKPAGFSNTGTYPKTRQVKLFLKWCSKWGLPESPTQKTCQV